MPRRPGLGHNGLAPSADERLHVRVNSNLITLRSILDLDIARRFEWDAALVVELSGVDRPGDLSPRVAEDPGVLYDIASQGIAPGSAIERALSHELHDAIQRRCRLWMAGIPTGHLDRLRSELGEGIVHVAGAPDEGLTPVALAPLELLKAWSQGSDRQRAFVRKSMAGLDTLTTSSTATWAARQVGAPIIERSVFLRPRAAQHGFVRPRLAQPRLVLNCSVPGRFVALRLSHVRSPPSQPRPSARTVSARRPSARSCLARARARLLPRRGPSGSARLVRRPLRACLPPS